MKGQVDEGIASELLCCARTSCKHILSHHTNSEGRGSHSFFKEIGISICIIPKPQKQTKGQPEVLFYQRPENQEF